MKRTRVVIRTIGLTGCAVAVFVMIFVASLVAVPSGARSESALPGNATFSSGTSQTFPVRGPFSTQRVDRSPVNVPSKPEIRFTDEPDLIVSTAGRTAPSSTPLKNEPGDSTIEAGDIPKVFQGFSTDATNLETRDMQIAASHTHVVIASYHQLTFWTRDGALQSSVKTLDFFKLVQDDINKVLKDPADSSKLVSAQYPIDEFYDTRVIFDTYRNRFWIVCLTRNMGPGSPNAAHRVTVSSIAVSKSENPQDGFFTYWMPPCRDYQAIGVSKKLFVVGYSSGVNYPEYGFMSVLKPEQLSNGVGGQKVTVLGGFKNPDGSAATAYMQPALQYGTSWKDLQFFVSNPSDGKNNIVWALDPANPTQLLQVAVPVATTVPPKAAEQASHPDIPHPQLVWPVYGSTKPYRGPNMVMKAIYRNDKLYWVWEDSVPGDTRQIRFIRLNRVDVGAFPSKLLLGMSSAIDRRFGKRNVSDPPNDIFSYYMPSLAVNRDGTMVINYSRSGATIWPQARFSVYFEKNTDISPSQLLHKGDYPIGTADAAYSNNADYRLPAGIFDYNCSAVDPLDDRSVWTINVYATKYNVGTGQYKLLVQRIPFNNAP